MSFWYEVKKDALSMSDVKDELHIWIKDDYQGAVYVSIPMDILREFLKEIL